MKAYIAALIFAVALLAVSVALAQQDGAVAAKPSAAKKAASVYDELSKAP